MYLIAVAVSLAALSSSTIVRRADRSDAAYLEAGAKYPAVIPLGRVGDATLIDRQWLLTAAHVANAVRHGRGPRRLAIGGSEYEIDRVAVHGSWRELGPHDVGLIRLDRPVNGVAPVALYRGNGERGAIATLVGHGGFGRGDSRERSEDGRARAATSQVDSVSVAWLYFSFDSPPGGTELEGAPGPGDSGGPAILTVGGRAMVAGVSSAGYDGRDGPGTYGAVDVFTRVSTHLTWIDSVLRAPAAASPNTSPASQGAKLPDTPAGRRYAAFLQAMRVGTDSAILAFLEANFDERELSARPARDRLPNFRRLSERLRDAKVEAVTASEPTRLVARLTSHAGVTTIELLLAPETPHKIVDWRRFD